MAGLNLRGSLGVAGAATPSSSPDTISTLAYGGGSSDSVDNMPGTAGMGSIVVTAVATGVLAWLWWTLPR